MRLSCDALRDELGTNSIWADVMWTTAAASATTAVLAYVLSDSEFEAATLSLSSGERKSMTVGWSF